MSRDYDSRSSLYDEQDDGPPDRRGSCRYPVAEVPALLGWWETSDEGDEQATSFVDPERPSGAIQRPKLFDLETYTAIMARGPALRGGFHASRAAAARPQHQNGRAALPALASGKGEPAPAVKPLAGPPAVRAKTETRRESNGTGEPQMHSCRAHILDISHTGISLTSEFEPPQGQSVWVRLENREPSDWVEGSLAGISRREAGKYLVRIRFHQACPYDFFKATVYGGKKS